MSKKNSDIPEEQVRYSLVCWGDHQTLKALAQEVAELVKQKGVQHSGVVQQLSVPDPFLWPAFHALGPAPFIPPVPAPQTEESARIKELTQLARLLQVTQLKHAVDYERAVKGLVDTILELVKLLKAKVGESR